MAVETLGEAWSLGWRVHVRCASGKGEGMRRIPECGYSARLDMDTLLVSKGPSMPIADLGRRLFCPRCHQTRMRVFFDPATEPDRLRGKMLAGKARTMRVD